MEYDEFFTDSDKPYAENLNDSLMLLDAFDVTVPCSMPDMFNNGDFSSSVNVTRKCGVALVTLKSVDSGVTVGTDSISGTGSVVFRVYPNFNSFYKWSKIILEKSGTVAIGFKKADGTDITVTVAGDGTIGDAAALKMLEEIDVVLTLDNASISNILIWFVNNQGERVRTSALLEAEQLVNVDGAVVDNDLRAVSGDTVKGALDSFESDVVDEKISDLSDSVDGKLSDLSDNVDSGLALKENVANKVTTLDNSTSHYPSCSAVKNVADTKENINYPKQGAGATNKIQWSYYSNDVTMYFIVKLLNFSMASTDSNKSFGNFFNSSKSPKCEQRVILPEGLYAELDTSGNLTIYNPFQKNISNLTVSFSFMYILKANLID